MLYFIIDLPCLPRCVSDQDTFAGQITFIFTVFNHFYLIVLDLGPKFPLDYPKNRQNLNILGNSSIFDDNLAVNLSQIYNSFPNWINLSANEGFKCIYDIYFRFRRK